MGMIRLEAMPSLAETLGVAATSEEVVADKEIARGYSVREVLNRLCRRSPRWDLVFDLQAQELTGQVIIFLNGRNLELRDGLKTQLQDGDMLTFIPLVEGG